MKVTCLKLRVKHKKADKLVLKLLVNASIQMRGKGGANSFASPGESNATVLVLN